MAFDTASFGSADGSNVNQQVSNHYGARNVGNQEGVTRTAGADNEAVVNFDGDALDLPIFLPAESYVYLLVDDFATGAITTATVGGTDISGAGSTSGGTTDPAVVGPVSGELVITGPSAGSVVVYYRHLAA
jgi:hypothetical protein